MPIPPKPETSPILALPTELVFQAVRRLVFNCRLMPARLNPDKPPRLISDINMIMRLSRAHPQFLDMVRNLALAYARSGMEKDLCEFAACRDVRTALERLLIRRAL